jgi:F0F1-type ATP synthase assembly protein I
MSKSPRPPDNRSALRYLGLATQIMASLALSVWAGIQLDRFLGIFPLLTVVCPLIVLFALFYKIIRDTRQ